MTLNPLLGFTDRQKLVLLAIFVLAVFLRLFQLHLPDQLNFDEAHYVPAAKILVGIEPHPGLKQWHQTPTIEKSPDINFSHPPFGKFLIGAGILWHGDNPFGHRIMSSIFGILSVFLFFLTARLLTNEFSFVALATFLFSVEFLQIIQSRIAMLDIFMLFWIQLAFLGNILWTFYPQHRRLGFALTALGTGLGFATKVPAGTAGLSALLVLWFCSPFSWREKLKQSLSLFAVSILVYGLWYFYYASYDYTFWEWIRFHYDVAKKVGGPLAAHPFASHPAQWILNSKPVWYYFKQIEEYRYGIIGMSNPGLWFFAIPAMATLWAGARSGSDLKSRFLIIWLLSGYIPLVFMLWSRQGYLYHVLLIVPVVVLIIAKAAVAESKLYAPKILVGLSILALVFFSPVILCLPLPGEWYMWIVKLCGV